MPNNNGQPQVKKISIEEYNNRIIADIQFWLEKAELTDDQMGMLAALMHNYGFMQLVKIRKREMPETIKNKKNFLIAMMKNFLKFNRPDFKKYVDFEYIKIGEYLKGSINEEKYIAEWCL